MPAELIVISPGVARLSWTADLQDRGVGDASIEVRRVVDEGFAIGHRRIEAYVDPDDTTAQRLATFSGLMNEGIARGAVDGADRIVYARLVDDTPVEDPMGFRRLLNSFLPRKRAIAQMLIRSEDDRVLLCRLTYKTDWDLPGGVVEVGESPRLAVAREVEEELGLDIPAGPLVLTDWLPPWGGWDDAVCLVFDGGVHPASLVETIVKQQREIRDAQFLTPAEAEARCADFTHRRLLAALRNVSSDPGPAYTESGRDLGD